MAITAVTEIPKPNHEVKLDKPAGKREINTAHLYYIERVDTEYYFGRVRDRRHVMLSDLCIGLPGVKKFFKTELGTNAKVKSATVAEYPLYEKECGIKIKTEFIAQKVTNIYS